MNKYNNSKAIALMILHAFAAASLLMLMKVLVKDIKSSQVVFFYKLTLLILILPWILYQGSFSNLKTNRFKTYLIGGIFGTSGTLCLMYGVKYIPLANVTILGYLEKIILVAIGLIFYKEKINNKKIIAILVSFIGAVIVSLPEMESFTPFNKYYLYIYASIILWVIYCVIVKSLSSTENIKTQTFYTILLSTCFSFPIAFIDWQLTDNFPILIPLESLACEVTFYHFPIILLTALCYFIISVSFFKSMKLGDLAIITPFGYTKIIFAGLYGIIFFHETPSFEKFFGYILIVLASWYLITTSSIMHAKKQFVRGAPSN